MRFSFADFRDGREIMKVIGICGSPRRGNTEWMLNKLLERMAMNGAETELILLRKKNINFVALFDMRSRRE
jgi:multimeric flavodoxin WrbA